MEILKILKANPYHDERGRFTTNGLAKSVSSWAEFGSPAGYKKQMATREGRVELFHKELNAIVDKFKAGHVSTRIYKIPEMAEQWENIVGDKITPAQFMRGMLGTKHKPDNFIVQMRFDETDSRLLFNLEGGTFHGEKLSSMSRDFDFKSGVAHHGYLKLAGVESSTTSTGSGAVKEFFRNAVPMYKKAGLKKIELNANLQVGGYAWARYGFKATSPSEGMEHAKRAWVMSKDPKVQKYLDKLIDKGYKDAEVAKNLPRFVAAIKEQVKAANGDLMSLGKRVMLETTWGAELDLTDAAALRRLERYIRPKKKK